MRQNILWGIFSALAYSNNFGFVSAAALKDNFYTNSTASSVGGQVTKVTLTESGHTTVYTTTCPESSSIAATSAANSTITKSNNVVPTEISSAQISQTTTESSIATSSALPTLTNLISSDASGSLVISQTENPVTSSWSLAQSTAWKSENTPYNVVTSTIFVGSVKPVSVPAGDTTYVAGSSKSNPVTCGEKSTVTLTYIVDTSTITEDCTISNTKTVANTASVTSALSVSATSGFVTSYISSSTAAVESGSHSTQTLSPSSTKSASDSGSTIDLFKPVSTDEPPDNFKQEDLDFDLVDGIDNNGGPIQTNKFYTNFFLGSQASSVFTYPYSVWWEYSSDPYFGLGVSHTTADSLVFGEALPEDQGGAPSYYLNPTKVISFAFSADSFSEDNVSLKLNNLTDTSALLTLYDNSTSENDNVQFPLVEGQGFITAIYSGGLTAKLASQVGISSFSQVSSDNVNSGTVKYRAELNNGVAWLVYATVPEGSDSISLESDDSAIKASGKVDGLVIQISIAPEDDKEKYYDSSAGLYTTSAAVSGYTSDDGQTATYSISYKTEGSSKSGKPIVFALPHHLESLSSETNDANTDITLFSTTKGNQTAFQTDSLTFNEELESSAVGFLPYSTLVQSNDLSYTSEQVSLLADSANHEFAVDIESTLKSLSTYYAGKYLDKFSYILLVSSEIIKDEEFTKNSLETLKNAFDEVFNAELDYKLFYDTKFKGITSDAAQNGGDPGEDFGAPYYNDHHFHYGYFIHAAANIGYVDAKLGGSWAKDHKDFINALVRDVNNPSDDDKYFPKFRSFDWYHGHSWASGLFEAADGNNQESSSEDFNFAYGLKTWGNVIGDKSMEYRGDLMISILKRSLNSYYYYTDDNKVQPAKFIPNKVGGILFDNKIDHTTFFGTNPEYVHGIHMIPTTPISSIIRGPKYTKEEWDDTLASVIDNVQSGWTGILRLNQALFDPKSSYEFFSQDNFNDSLLDDGQSRTWSLAYSGGIANLYNSDS